MRKSTILKLQDLNACSEAIVWAGTYPSMQVAWDVCERVDWMIWLLSKTSGDRAGSKRKELALIMCRSVTFMLPYIKKEKKKLVQKNLRAIRKWARSDATCPQPHFTISNRIFEKLKPEHKKIILRRAFKLIRKAYPKPPQLRKL